MNMKKLRYLGAIVISLLLVSCGEKGVKPEQVKITGPLGEFFEVVDRNYAIKDGKLTVEIKRIKDGLPAPWHEGVEVGYDNGTCTPLFNIELRDGTGNIVGKDKNDIVYDRDELVAVVSLSVDESASITFSLSENKGATFKIGSSFKVNGEKTDASNSGSVMDGEYDLRGAVSKYPITMHIEIDANIVKGSYYYDKRGPNAKLNLSGTCNNELLDINETDANGTPTGHFNGYLRDGVFKGQFTTNKGDKMNFALTTGDVNELSIDEEIVSSSNDDSDNGSTDWDELLDSYERYVNSYISLIKKAKNGDTTALAEYASVLEDANDLNEKIQNAKSDLNSSQLARYNKLTLKLANAAQQMQ